MKELNCGNAIICSMKNIANVDALSGVNILRGVGELDMPVEDAIAGGELNSETVARLQKEKVEIQITEARKSTAITAVFPVREPLI